jgi:hypothetical protein
METTKLKDMLNQNKGLITSKMVKQVGIHPQYFSNFIKTEKLIKVSSGVYQRKDAWEDMFFIFQQKKQMIYSHLTSAYLHGLIDRDPMHYYVTLPTGYNTSYVHHPLLKTFTIKRDLFKVGLMFMPSPFGHPIQLYDKERTLCDLIRSRSKLDKALMIQALKSYAVDRKRNMTKLMTYAAQFDVANIIRTYLEVL